MVSLSTQRIYFLSVFTLYMILTTALSAGLSKSFTNFIPHIISIAFWVIYIPAAFIVPPVKNKKGRTTRWDRAWGEMAWLAAQFVFWGLSLGLSIAQRVGSQCRTMQHISYSVESPYLQFNGVISNMRLYCRGNVVTAVLSAVQLVFIAGWMVVVVKIVRRGQREGKGGWGTGVYTLLHGRPGVRVADDEEAYRLRAAKVGV
ncbi:hypothetical protein IAT38_003538 [Cryptococcus sp. DSM 104549]